MAVGVAAVAGVIAVLWAGIDGGDGLPTDGEVSMPASVSSPAAGPADGPQACTASRMDGCVRWRLALTGDTSTGPGEVPAVASAGTVFVRTDRTTLTAAGIGDGRVRWRTRIPGGWRPAAVSLDALLLRGPDGTIATLSASTGRRLWSHVAQPTGAPPPRVVSTPPWTLVRDGARIRAIGSATGNVVWETAVPEGARALLLDAGAFTVDDRTLTSLSANTGLPRWRIPLPGALIGLATSPETLTVITRDGTVTSVHRARGAIRWRAEDALGSLVVLDVVAVPELDLLLAAAVDRDADRLASAVDRDDDRHRGRIVALDLDSGAPVWQTGLIRAPRLPDGIEEAAGAVHVTMPGSSAGDSEIVALAASDGTRRWTRTVAGSQPQLGPSGAAIVVGTRTGLTGLDPRAGHVDWQLDLGPTHVVTLRPLVVATPDAVIGLRSPGP